MQYLTLLSGDAPAGPPPASLMGAIMAVGQEAAAAGVLLAQSGLQPSAAGARITLEDDTISVLDGPFTEAKELISYAVYDCASLEEATEWSRRFLAAHQEHWPGWTGQITIHPAFVAPDAGQPG